MSDSEQIVISVRQPHADQLLQGTKPFEYRNWVTNHRGRLWIHASKKVDPGGAGLPTGGLVGRVRLIEIVRSSSRRWKFAWRVEPELILDPPLPMPGQLGLFRLPRHIARKVKTL